MVNDSEQLAARSGLEIHRSLLERVNALKIALAADQRDHLQAKRLENIRLSFFEMIDFDQRGVKVLPQLEIEFRNIGFGAQDVTLEEAASRIRESTIRWHWVASLYFYYLFEPDRTTAERAARLASVSDERDSWRERLAKARGRLEFLRLAQDPAVVEQPPAILGPVATDLGRVSGGVPRALELLRSAMVRYPRNHVLYMTAAHLCEDHDPEKAAAYHRVAVALRPTDEMATWHLARLYTTRGAKLMVENKADAAMSYFRDAIALRSDFATAHLNMAENFRRRQKYRDAASAYRSYLKIDTMKLPSPGKHVFPRTQSDTESPRAEAYNNLGNVLMEIGELDEAIQPFREAINVDQRYVLPYHNIAAVYHTTNRFDDAVKWLRKATSVGPLPAESHISLVFALRDQGDFIGSVKAAREFLQSHPMDFVSVAKAKVMLADAERVVEVDKQIPSILAGEIPKYRNTERLTIGTKASRRYALP